MRVVSLALTLSLTGCSLTLEFDGLAGADAESFPTPGSVGTGVTPRYEGFPLAEIVSGFVVGDELVIAVYVQGSQDHEGAMLGVDLTTGDRRFIAGRLTDVTNTTYDGGPYLDGVRAVRAIEAGWAALVWDGWSLRARVEIFDPETSSVRESRALGAACDGLELERSGQAPVLGPSAEMFLPFVGPDSARGVLRITETDCEPLALGRVSALYQEGTRLWFTDPELRALKGYDLTTKQVLDHASPVATEVIAVGDSNLYTAEARPELELYRIDRQSGAHEAMEASGFAAHAIQRTPDLWLHSNGRDLIVELDGAITRVDAETGQSELISY